MSEPVFTSSIVSPSSQSLTVTSASLMKSLPTMSLTVVSLPDSTVMGRSVVERKV